MVKVRIPIYNYSYADRVQLIRWCSENLHQYDYFIMTGVHNLVMTLTIAFFDDTHSTWFLIANDIKEYSTD